MSETGTGLLVSFVPHPDAPDKPYIVESSIVEPSSGNRYQNDDKDYLGGTNQDLYSDSKGGKKNKNSLMGTIKTISSKVLGLSGKE